MRHAIIRLQALALASGLRPSLSLRNVFKAIHDVCDVVLIGYSDSVRLARMLCNSWPYLRFCLTGSITFRDRPCQAHQQSKGGVVEKKGEAHSWELVRGIPT